MAGVTRIEVQETAAELEALIQKQSNPKLKERLQVLYLLQLPNAMSISVIAKVIGRHRSSVQEWLNQYHEGGLERFLSLGASTGRPRAIPAWAVESLKKRLDDPERGFGSYTQVQQWLSETLNVEAEYATGASLGAISIGCEIKGGSSGSCQTGP